MPGSEEKKYFAGRWLDPEGARETARKVTQVFAASGVPLSVAFDASWPDSEELEEDFAGLPWPVVDLDLIAHHKDDLFLMTPEAFHYYLPSYIVRCLEDPIETDVAMSAVVSALCEPDRSRSGSAWYGNDRATAFSLFSQEERLAVLDFLRFATLEGFVNDSRDPVGYWESLSYL